MYSTNRLTCLSQATFTNNGQTSRRFGFQGGEDKGSGRWKTRILLNSWAVTP